MENSSACCSLSVPAWRPTVLTWKHWNAQLNFAALFTEYSDQKWNHHAVELLAIAFHFSANYPGSSFALPHNKSDCLFSSRQPVVFTIYFFQTGSCPQVHCGVRGLPDICHFSFFITFPAALMPRIIPYLASTKSVSNAIGQWHNLFHYSVIFDTYPFIISLKLLIYKCNKWNIFEKPV